MNAAEPRLWRAVSGFSFASPAPYAPPMHYDAHQPVIADLEARISTIRDSL
jgi:hypothetical protein